MLINGLANITTPFESSNITGADCRFDVPAHPHQPSVDLAEYEQNKMELEVGMRLNGVLRLRIVWKTGRTFRIGIANGLIICITLTIRKWRLNGVGRIFRTGTRNGVLLADVQDNINIRHLDVLTLDLTITKYSSPLFNILRLRDS